MTNLIVAQEDENILVNWNGDSDYCTYVIYAGDSIHFVEQNSHVISVEEFTPCLLTDITVAARGNEINTNGAATVQFERGERIFKITFEDISLNYT